MANDAYILAATRENFDQLVLDNSRRGLVVVDFWSPRAGPSLRQREVLTRLAGNLNGRFLLITVNTDDQKELARDYAVHSLPSLKLFRGGRVVEDFRGMQPEADYQRIVERHLADTGGAVQRAAVQAWQAGDGEKAIQILVDGAMADPENPRLPLLMAKLLIRQGRQDDAYALLSALPEGLRDDPEVAQLTAHLDFIVTAAGEDDSEQLHARLRADPEDHASRYRLASLCLIRDDYDGAMEQLMSVYREAPDFRGGVARRGLLALFNMLDAGDERVKRFRAELFRLSH